MRQEQKHTFKHLTTTFLDKTIESINPLPGSGSYRQYFRIKLEDGSTVIGAYNEDIAENEAFYSYSETFRVAGINIPMIYGIDEDRRHYLLQDLGDEILLNYLDKFRTQSGHGMESMEMTKKALKGLVHIQLIPEENIDYSKGYPRSAFDRQSILWDLWYFKYYFLKVFKVPFYEQELENDFNTLTDFLLSTDTSFFLFRDFQSRNIMIHDGEPYFIDYQGGRKGALQYDLASLLYDAKANFSVKEREELYNYYIAELSKHIEFDQLEFSKQYQAYALVRILQAMGAYGFRGIVESKAHFILSIPFGIKNLKGILESWDLNLKIPHLMRALHELVEIETVNEFKPCEDKLLISINSFSFRNGLPLDESGNGGGFVFDCRGLDNPGRREEYKRLTGNDRKTIEYLENSEETLQFVENIKKTIQITIDEYLKLGRSHLMINFGCTGGQHRSVYCANRIFDHLNEVEQIQASLRHIEIEKGII